MERRTTASADRPRRTQPPPHRSPKLLTHPPALAAGAAVIVALIVWALWPSSLSEVRNLDSRGSSIIAFGDSLTAGYGAGPGEDYPSILASDRGRTIVNAGVSGDTTDSALARLDAVIRGSDPRVVIVGLGGNDFLRGIPIETTERNLRQIVREIQGEGAMVILLGFAFPSLSVSYDEMYERVAEEEGCLFVPDILDGILANASLKSDAIHPNGAGYRIMAERITPPLEKLIAKADRSRP